jgi:hypothetical protein
MAVQKKHFTLTVEERLFGYGSGLKKQTVLWRHRILFLVFSIALINILRYKSTCGRLFSGGPHRTLSSARPDPP